MRLFGNIFCLIFLLLALGNCGNSSSKAHGTTPVGQTYADMKYPLVINPLEKYEKKPLLLTDAAEIKYIPLQTDSTVLLSNILNNLAVSNDRMVTMNQKGFVFIFDENGRLKSRFNHRGKSAKEYQSIYLLAVDFDQQEIYVYDFPLCHRLLVYSMTGDFKRSFDLPATSFVEDLVDYDPQYLLAYMQPTPSARQKQSPPYHLYYLVSKQDGTCKPLGLTVSEIKDGKVRQNKEVAKNRTRSRVKGFRTSPIIKNGNDVFISDFACDTIYVLREGKLSPFIVSAPSLQRPGSSVFVGLSLQTTRYSFLNIITAQQEEMEVSQKFLAIDHLTGEIFEPDFHRENLGMIPDNYFRDLPAEYSAVSISSYKLTNAYEKGKLAGDMLQIASRVKEDDNPVIALIKFKK